jgi:YVTN family beta-propeller protein
MIRFLALFCARVLMYGVVVVPVGISAQPRLPPRMKLPNGWSLTPAGRSVALSSDLPLNMAVSPDSQYVAITNNGNGRQTIDLLEVKTGRLVQAMDIGKAWLGLAFDPEHPYLYASGGNDNIVLRFRWKDRRLTRSDTIRLGMPWPAEKIGPAGLAVDGQRQRLYLVTKENNSLYVCDLKTMQVLSRVQLSAQAYTCLLNPRGTELYISGWGNGRVFIYNTATDRLQDSVMTGDNPNDLALSRDGKRLYVANAVSNSVSVIDLDTKRVEETLSAALYPLSPIGSTTNSLSLSPDGSRLYVANADNNCLAVFDVSIRGRSRAEGFIPTGWYPTCVRALDSTVLVINGKGMSSFANPRGPQPRVGRQLARYKKSDSTEGEQYIGSLFKGTLSLIPTPGLKDLGVYAQAVYRNTPYSKQKETVAAGLPGNPVPRRKGETSPIQYVFYIIKENRTYDQVFGDIAKGHGDSSLCLFDARVTPNAHALAAQFVLLDNFYVDGEVSVDGHCWSTEAYATDFVEKNWPSDYSGRGGTDDFDGAGPIGASPKGYIWDYCVRAGVSFRNYGEMLDNTNHKLKVFDDSSTFCASYPTWNLGIPDVCREQAFEHDFDSLVAAGKMRHLNTLYLPNDHTCGDAADSLTPIAYVADNDLALGRLVEHISHSPIWPQTAIFVLEDDAQGGPDHIDAHRSTALVISPYVQPHSVDHTPYTTTGMLRTIELILGLPPMSQYDAAATPMYNSFQKGRTIAAYNARAAQVDLNERNRRENADADRDASFDFTIADRSPAKLLNEAIWKAVKGRNSVMPAPRTSAFFQQQDN